jgi:hypothetical protein
MQRTRIRDATGNVAASDVCIAVAPLSSPLSLLEDSCSISALLVLVLLETIHRFRLTLVGYHLSAHVYVRENKAC